MENLVFEQLGASSTEKMHITFDLKIGFWPVGRNEFLHTSLAQYDDTFLFPIWVLSGHFAESYITL